MEVRADDKTVFGFWVYLMTDCVLFASLFATYAVLAGNTFGGPAAADLFDLDFVLIETLILLTSSLTAGLSLLAARAGARGWALNWLLITLGLGLAFLGMELYEFTHLVHAGHSWQRSAFLSAFFTLVGTHGAHILAGLIWGTVLVSQLIGSGLTASTLKRLTLWSLFWHFLDLVWIFIFSFVYLIGVAR